MLSIFLAISQTFVDSGFSTALVRKLDRTDADFSTVFYFNIVVGLFFYLVLWLASPYIAAFYGTPLLEDVTKVVALTLVFSSFSGVQNAKLSIAINFKTGAKVSVTVDFVVGSLGLVDGVSRLWRVGFGGAVCVLVFAAHRSLVVFRPLDAEARVPRGVRFARCSRLAPCCWLRGCWIRCTTMYIRWL